MIAALSILLLAASCHGLWLPGVDSGREQGSGEAGSAISVDEDDLCPLLQDYFEGTKDVYANLLDDAEKKERRGHDGLEKQLKKATKIIFGHLGFDQV